MRIYITILVSVVVGTLLSILVRNIIRRINRKIWKFSKIDTLVFYLPFAAVFFAVLWFVGRILISSTISICIPAYDKYLLPVFSIQH